MRRLYRIKMICVLIITSFLSHGTVCAGGIRYSDDRGPLKTYFSSGSGSGIFPAYHITSLQKRQRSVTDLKQDMEDEALRFKANRPGSAGAESGGGNISLQRKGSGSDPRAGTNPQAAEANAKEAGDWSLVFGAPQAAAAKDVIPPVISNIAPGSLTASSAVIKWVTNEDSSSQIVYGLTKSYGSSTAPDTQMVKAHAQAISGLKADTTYHYAVISKDKAGNQTRSADYTFRTLAAAAPLAISSVAASGIGPGSATISWVTNNPGTSQIKYGLTKSYGTTTVVDYKMATGHSQTLTGLQADKTYYYCVVSKDVSGKELISAEYTFKTAKAAPADRVGAQVYSTKDGPVLKIIGSDLDDNIRVSEDTQGLRVTTSSGTRTYTGWFFQIYIDGMGGNDTITVESTVFSPADVKGGSGDDQLFVYSSGYSTLDGGEGDDLLVTVGSGVDYLTGGSGLDSFWCDNTDTIFDISSQETANETIHQISQFYQPFTNDSTSADYVPLLIAGQTLRDPETWANIMNFGVADVNWRQFPLPYKNFSSLPLFLDGAQYDDIRQGITGDCYFLAGLASLAENPIYGITRAERIRQTIAPFGDGTFGIRYYSSGRPVYMRIDADLPLLDGSTAYAGFGADKELWVPLLEKSYAYIRSGDNNYNSLWGGWMHETYTSFTNSGYCAFDLTEGIVGSLFDFLQDQLSNGHAVSLGSQYDIMDSDPIVENHAYAVRSVQVINSIKYFTVYNPYGIDCGTPCDLNPQDGLITIPINQIANYFRILETSSAYSGVL